MHTDYDTYFTYSGGVGDKALCRCVIHELWISIPIGMQRPRHNHPEKYPPVACLSFHRPVESTGYRYLLCGSTDPWKTRGWTTCREFFHWLFLVPSIISGGSFCTLPTINRTSEFCPTLKNRPLRSVRVDEELVCKDTVLKAVVF